MARVENPVLFSTYFKIDADELTKAGLIDPFINVDTPLFIDPVLLEKSQHSIIRNEALSDFRSHFGNFVRLIFISQNEGDAAWKAAERLLDLSEPPENGLGFGSSGRSGSSRPEKVRYAIMKTAKEIVALGSKDPEMISLMGFFEENVGPDTISDFTMKVITKRLAEMTWDFCRDHQIRTFESETIGRYNLPAFIDEKGNKKFLVLVPRDIVRDVPMANDWSSIDAAIENTKKLRDSVNSMLSQIAEPTVADRKEAIRKIALESPRSFEDFLSAIKDHAATYDPNEDALAYYKMKSIFAHGFQDIKSSTKYDITKGLGEIYSLVCDTIDLFKHHVEHGNLWEELWLGDKPKKERAAQLIYFAISDAFCKANNIDINPEANMGGGPIDFKFSYGYNFRVLVEMKKSGGTVVHGYERQLEFYKNASKTEAAIFVVLDYGDIGNKLMVIRGIQENRLRAGGSASEIIVIDATKKASASKRI